MEPPVVAIHTVKLAGVQLPYLLGFDDMKPAAVFLIEQLHFTGEKQTVKIIREAGIPTGRPAVGAYLHNQLGSDHMLGDLAVKLLQYAFIDAGENISGKQRLRLQLIKAGREPQFLLYGTADLIKAVVILLRAPFVDNPVAVGFVRFGDKPFQAPENRGIHGL